jgi:hypothetical protein
VIKAGHEEPVADSLKVSGCAGRYSPYVTQDVDLMHGCSHVHCVPVHGHLTLPFNLAARLSLSCGPDARFKPEGCERALRRSGC